MFLQVLSNNVLLFLFEPIIDITGVETPGNILFSSCLKIETIVCMQLCILDFDT